MFNGQQTATEGKANVEGNKWQNNRCKISTSKPEDQDTEKGNEAYFRIIF